MSSALFESVCPRWRGSIHGRSERILSRASVAGRFTLLNQPSETALCLTSPAHQVIKASTTSSTPQSCHCVPEFDRLSFHRSPCGVRYLSVFADTGGYRRALRPADTRVLPLMYLSACTRPLRGRVHPRHGRPRTSVPRRPLAREACIQDGLSPARKPCIQPSLSSARKACIQPGPSAREACIEGAFSARKPCIHPALPSTSPHA